MSVYICQGESKWAKQVAAFTPNTIHLDADALRASFFEQTRPQDEKFLTRTICEMTAQSLLKEYNVVVSGLSRNGARHVQNAAGTLGYVYVVNLLGDEFDQNAWIPFHVITPSYAIQLMKSEKQTHYVPYVADQSLPEAVLVDLDGTLAILNGRDPYDASVCHTDRLNEVINGIIQEFDNVLLMTGRPDHFREPTEDWLANNDVGYDILLMRDKPQIPDSIMKYELFDKHVRNEYNVKLVLEDRSSVVRMWRNMGLNCFQVAHGDF